MSLFQESETGSGRPELEPKGVKELKDKGGPPGGTSTVPATGGSAKAAAMEAIQKALTSSRLNQCKIWNLWTATVCEKGLDTSKIKGTGSLQAAPVTIPESATYGSLKLGDRIAYASRYNELTGEKDADKLVTMSPDNLAEMRSVLKAGYLRWGRTNYGGFTGGNCTYIAGVTVGWLASNIGLIPTGARVEQFNLSSGGQGHAFVVIGRDPDSRPGTLSSWGSNWFVIDPWYARQRFTPPGPYAVKDPADTSGFYDQDFVTFITDGVLTQGPAFTIEELLSLR
jgi:hypothetical protein